MLDLIDHGAPNIICTQPFACLPNHVVGKAVIKELRRQHPESNIVAVDYDPGASEVNQLNRIKLMISVAKENMRAGKGFTMESVKPLAMDMDDSKFRPDHTGDAGHGGRWRPCGGSAAEAGSCTACGAGDRGCRGVCCRAARWRASAPIGRRAGSRPGRPSSLARSPEPPC